MSRNLLIALIVVLAVIAVVEAAMLFGLHQPAKSNEARSFALLGEPATNSRMSSSQAIPSLVSPAPGSPTSPVAIDPFAELERMRREMDARMQEAMRQMQAGASGSSIMLSTPGDSPQTVSDIAMVDDGDRYVCTIRIEGVDDDSIRVTVEDDVLSVSGKHTTEQTREHQGKIIAHLQHTEQFTRSVQLPGPVEPTCIKTSFKDGVLTVDVPKPKPMSPTTPLP